MPSTEAQKRAVNKWRERNRDKYNERQRKYANTYNAKHREERRDYSLNYYYKKINETIPAPKLELDEFLDQFNEENLTDEE